MEGDLDTCIAFEHVEQRDVLRGEAHDQRTADAVLLRSELASEQPLAPLARDDSRIVFKLNEDTYNRCE